MSYNSNSLYINNPCHHGVNACPLSLCIVDITAANSPFTLTEQGAIIVNATAGNIQINLTANPTYTNHTLYIKKTDATANLITIVPPAGELVNGGASYVLNKQNLVIQLIRDTKQSPVNWVLLTNFIDQIANGTATGDILIRNATGYTNFPVGTNGQVLTADNTQSQGVRWNTSSSGLTAVANVGTGTGLIFRDITGTTINLKTLLAGTGISITNNADDITITNTATTPSKTYTLALQQITANSTTYTSIGFFTYITTEHAGILNGDVNFTAIINNRNLDIRLYDTTNAVVLGSSAGINLTGFYSFTINSIPPANAQLVLQIRKTNAGGVSPIVSGVAIN